MAEAKTGPEIERDEIDYCKWGVPSVKGDVCLSPAALGAFEGVMALVTADAPNGNRAIVFRGIEERRGNPGAGDADFIDRSGLYTIENGEVAKVVVEGAEKEPDDFIATLPPHRRYKLLGREDPALVWEGDTLHMFDTIAVSDEEETMYYYTVGHAAGPSISELRAQALPFAASGKKELCFDATEGAAVRGGLLEQAYLGYSTIARYRTPSGVSGEFVDTKITLIPQYAKEYFGGSYSYDHLPDNVAWSWIKEHASPCAMVPPEYIDIDPEHILGLKASVVVMSARSASHESTDGKVVQGPFRVGLGLVVSEAESPHFGEFLWVSPLPAFIEQTPCNITFASDCKFDNDGMTIFAHIDDTLVCQYHFTWAEIAKQLPTASELRAFVDQRLYEGAES